MDPRSWPVGPPCWSTQRPTIREPLNGHCAVDENRQHTHGDGYKGHAVFPHALRKILKEAYELTHRVLDDAAVTSRKRQIVEDTTSLIPRRHLMTDGRSDGCVSLPLPLRCCLEARTCRSENVASPTPSTANTTSTIIKPTPHGQDTCDDGQL